MKVDQYDVAQIDESIVGTRDATLVLMKSLFEYLDGRTDFNSGALSHVAAVAEIEHIINGMAELQMWAGWRIIVTSMLDDAAKTGATVTMEQVSDRLTDHLLRRMQLGKQMGSTSAFGQAYTRAVTDAYAHAVITTQTLIDAEPATISLCEKVAPTRGLTTDELFEKVRTRDPEATKAVGKAALQQTIERCIAAGEEPPHIPQFLVEALGLTPEDLPHQRAEPRHATGLSEALGLDPEGLNGHADGVPHFPPGFTGRHHAPQEGIKVG